MAIPDFQTVMLPILRQAESGEVGIAECIGRLAEEFALSEDEKAELLPSGKQATFANRVHWAKTHLVKAGMLRATRRAHFELTQRGRDALQKNPARIDVRYLRQFEAYQEFTGRSAAQRNHADQPTTAMVETATPEEQIEAAHEILTGELRVDLLGRITHGTPAFFEKVIVDLMLAMGYGGSAPGAGKRLGRSGDGGIDGLINEDVLGLDSIYLQAKRYARGNTVGVDKVREFAGSLVERGANKGVFVTTSHFANGATTYAERIPQKLILIDGGLLTRLMVRHGVGVRVTQTIELKKLDLDYFESDDWT